MIDEELQIAEVVRLMCSESGRTPSPSPCKSRARATTSRYRAESHLAHPSPDGSLRVYKRQALDCPQAKRAPGSSRSGGSAAEGPGGGSAAEGAGWRESSEVLRRTETNWSFQSMVTMFCLLTPLNTAPITTFFHDFSGYEFSGQTTAATRLGRTCADT